MGEDKLELNYLDHEKEIEQLIKSDDSIIQLMTSGRYFELPLRRARQFERWRKVTRTGLGKVLMQEFDTLKDDFDLTQTSSKHHSLI
jgi:CHASE3 domain sensor protein